MPVSLRSERSYGRHGNRDDHAYEFCNTKTVPSGNVASQKSRYDEGDYYDATSQKVDTVRYGNAHRLPTKRNVPFSSQRMYNDEADDGLEDSYNLELQPYRPISRDEYRKSYLSLPARHTLALCADIDDDDDDEIVTQFPYNQRDSIGHDDAEDDDLRSTRRSRRDSNQRPVDRQRPHSSYNHARCGVTAMRRGHGDAWPRRQGYEDDFDDAESSPAKRDDVIVQRSSVGCHDREFDPDDILNPTTKWRATRRRNLEDFPERNSERYRSPPDKAYTYKTRGADTLELFADSIYTHDSDHVTERLDRAPVFDMKIRSHVIWEKMYVKFTCTIRGKPSPRVTWFHNMVAIEPLLVEPGHVRISSQYGVHTLEIHRARLADSGTYRVSAQNHKGEISSYATLLVRRYDRSKSGYYDVRSDYNVRKRTQYPDVDDLNVPGTTDAVADIGSVADFPAIGPITVVQVAFSSESKKRDDDDDSSASIDEEIIVPAALSETVWASSRDVMPDDVMWEKSSQHKQDLIERMVVIMEKELEEGNPQMVQVRSAPTESCPLVVEDLVVKSVATDGAGNV